MTGWRARLFAALSPDPRLSGDAAPAAVLRGASGVLLTAGLGASLFFTGAGNIMFAPAFMSLLAAFALVLLGALWRDRAVFPVAPMALGLYAFTLYITLGLGLSTVPFASLMTFLVIMSLPLAFLTGALAGTLSPGHTMSRLTLAGPALLIAALAIGAVWQVLVLGARRADMPLLDANGLAALLACGVLPALALLLASPRRDVIFYGAGAFALLTMAGLIATQSRGGLLATGIGASFILWVMRDQVRPHVKALLLGGLGALAFIILTGWRNNDSFLRRVPQLFDLSADISTRARLSLWESAWQMVMAHPFTGTGLGTFYLYYPAYRQPQDYISHGSWAHMDALQIGAETGLAGLVLFYALATVIALRTIRALRSPAVQSDRPRRARIIGAAAALLALFLHSHTSFILYLMPAMILAGLLMAWLYAETALPSARADTALRLPRVWHKLVMSVLVVLIVALPGITALRSAMGIHYIGKAKHAIEHYSIAGFTGYVAQARQWAPASFIEPEIHSAGLYIDILDRLTMLYNPSERQIMVQDTLALLQTAQAMNPAHAGIDYMRAQLYAKADKAGLLPNAAAQRKDSLHETLRKDPRHHKACWELAQIYMQEGRPAVAYDLLTTGLTYMKQRGITEEYKAILDQLRALAAIQDHHQKTDHHDHQPPRESTPPE